MRERFANSAVTTLSGAIDDTVTTLDVTDASEFPTVGNFRILIDSEILLVTDVSDNTFTVVRGQEGTSAASHLDSATVTHLLTAESLKRLVADNVPFAGYSRVLGRITDADGEVIDSTDFTWLNQGSATVTDYGGNMRLFHPTGTSTLNLRGLYVAAPSSRPWQVTMGFLVCAVGLNATQGLFVREAATNKLMWVARYTGGLLVERFSDPNTFVSPSRLNTTARLGHVAWFRIRVEGDTIKFLVSDNGVDWVQVYMEGLTDHFAVAPDQAGFACNASNNSAAQIVLSVLHWSFE